VTSLRKRKKQAAARGLDLRGLALAELVEEMLESMRWLWVLAYANQYLVAQKLDVDRAERDRILEAATRAVDRDGRLRAWRERLAAIRGEAALAQREVARATKGATRARPAAPTGRVASGTGDAR
jgi:hypothetical protein